MIIILEFFLLAAYIGTPICFLIINIIYYKKKKIIYTVYKENMKVVKDDYYKIQLIVSILTSILLILAFVFLYDKIILPIFLALYLGVFYATNGLLRFVAIKKNYLSVGNE